MKTVLEESPSITVEGLEIPFGVRTLEGFRTWFAGLGESAPRASFCAGRVFIEMTPQRYDDHEPLVLAVSLELAVLARTLDLGRYFFPPSWITHKKTGISTEPDGFFVEWERFEDGRFRINPRRKVEALGAPTMVFEAVSRSSPEKDLVSLMDLYFEAGVEEYWIADARDEKLDHRILVRGPRTFVARKPKRGWIVSHVWGKSFRLQRTVDRAGLPAFVLESR